MWPGPLRLLPFVWFIIGGGFDVSLPQSAEFCLPPASTSLFNSSRAHLNSPPSSLSHAGKFLIDYVRVYQDPAAVQTSCSPAGFPTAAYIASHPNDYGPATHSHAQTMDAWTGGAKQSPSA